MAEADFLTKPLAETTPMSPDVLACPHAYNARLRSEAPVMRCPQTNIVFVSDYDTICRIAKDHETFSNKFAGAMRAGGEIDPRLAAIQAEGYPAVDTMLTQDPPLHRRYRGMVNQAFTARRVSTMEPAIETLCNELINSFVESGECELIEDFAKRVPMTVIAEQLGVPLSDYELFRSWSDAFVAQLSRMATPDEELEATRLIVEYQKYFAAKLEERRTSPEDDIISDIVHAKLDDEVPLDIPEMLSVIQQLLVAGNETTTNSIAEGILLLIENPDQHAKLKADPSLIPNFSEEVLRLSTPTANMWRVVTKDTDINGEPVKKGDMVQIRFSSANRDEGVFPAPDALDVSRSNANRNIAFGHGVHMCVGASLARKELNVAFRVLLERLDNFELACDPDDLVYPPNVLLRGVAKLPVRFTARSE